MKLAFTQIVLIAMLLTGCGSSPSPVLPPVQLTAVDNAFNISRVWMDRIGHGAGDNYLKLAPVAENNMIYSVDHFGSVIAYDTEKRSDMWTTELSIPIATSITLDENLLLLGSSNGDVVALEKNDGHIVWRATVSSEVLAPPKSAKGVVVVRCVNGMLSGLDRKDGKQVWSLEQNTPALSLRGTSAPVIVGDIVLSAFDNGRLLAVNLQSGKMLWQTSISVPRGRTDLERMVDIDATPVVVDDFVYAVSFQGRVAAVQLGSGRIQWAREIDSYAGMAVDAYRLYLVDSEGQVWALDRHNGATLWKQDGLLRRSLTTPRLHNQYVVLADFNGFIHWLRRDNGKIAARVKINDSEYRNPNLDETEDLLFPKTNNILAPPLLVNDTLIAVDRYGHAEAFDVKYAQ